MLKHLFRLLHLLEHKLEKLKTLGNKIQMIVNFTKMKPVLSK
nr:MAG TPA: hypothetical protein [Caudoviricetes sp.]